MLIDIGANLTHDSFDHDRDDVLHRARQSGVEELIVTGASVTGSEDAVVLAGRYPQLYATVGIHPHHAEQTNAGVISRLRELTRTNKVKAIGETGLDFFRDLSPRPTQIASFEEHIELAIETGLPMFLHERDAYPVFADVLSRYRDRLSNAVVHCFTGEAKALHTYLDMDCYIGITGWICDERRGVHLQSLVGDIPDNRLMIETDSPYLLPRSIRPKPKTHRNEPHYLTEVCETVARCRNQSFAEIAGATTRNARAFFDLPDSRQSDAS